MSFVYNHRPAFYGTIRLHNSSGVFAWHTYLLEAKDTWTESDMDIKFTMTANNTTKTLQDYADENDFNIISGDAGSYNGGSHNRSATLAAYQITLDSGVTVSDLSSLENISVRSGLSTIPSGEEPVEITLDDQNTKIYTLGRKVQVRVNGTLNHDPDKEVLIVRCNRHSYQRESGTSWFNSAFSVGGTYNFGSEIADASLDRTSTTSGMGLIFTGDTANGSATDNWNPRNASVTGSGTWKCRGGVIQTNRMINFTGTLDVVGTTFAATHKSGSELEWRNPFGNTNSSFQGTFYKMYIVDPKFQPVLTFKGGGLAEVYGSWWEKELYNLDVSTNATDVDIGASSGDNHQHHDWHIINSATGSDIKHMWRKTTGNTHIRGNVFVKREVAINIKDGSGVAVEGCQVYVIDNPSDYAKDATFELNTYTTTPTHSRASITDGYITYNYADPVEYLEETDASGDTPTMKILISTSMHNANTSTNPNTITDKFPSWTGSTFANYADNFDGNRWEESDGSRVAYSDWDTDRFGGYFKVDRRGNDNTDADLFTFNFCSYGHNLAATTTTLKGLNTLNINWTLFEDRLITDTRANTDAYTEINTPQKFYNKAKAYLVDDYSGESETIVNRSGETIDIGSYDLDVDPNATDVFSFDGSKITIKASTFIGSITTTGGTITLLNNAIIVGTYGDISVLPFTITNVEAGSTVQLYNVTEGNEIVNDVVTGTTGTKVTFDGTYANSLAEPDDEVRLRITCQSGTTALLPYETFGVASTAGISFKANQVDDTIYNSNAIDGSASDYDNTSLEIDADYTNFEIDVSDTDNPGSVTVQQIYAKYAYLVTTSDGIDKFFGAITAENSSNYKINTSAVDLKIQNISSSDMIITGARLYRDDNTTIIRTGYLNNDQSQGLAGTLSHDTGEFLQYIQPQVEAATLSIKRNTNLIPGLL